VAAAEAGFRRALALNPDATTHFWYAVALERSRGSAARSTSMPGAPCFSPSSLTSTRGDRIRALPNLVARSRR